MTIDGDESEVNRFVDWIYGKESDATHGFAAKFVQAHARNRPAVGSGQPARWQHFDAMRTHVNNAGPNCTIAQLNTSIVAFRAS